MSPPPTLSYSGEDTFYNSQLLVCIIKVKEKKGGRASTPEEKTESESVRKTHTSYPHSPPFTIGLLLSPEPRNYLAITYL